MVTAPDASRSPRLGVGLWSLQSHLPNPRAHALLYSDLAEEALSCESLGVDSMWISEHHFWYDGYCPQPLIAAAQALSATTVLNIGTAMLLLPLHRPSRIAAAVSELIQLHGDRLQLGVAAGYAPSEFDAFGISLAERGRRLDAGLDMMLKQFDREGYQPPIWMGGASDAAMRRAARFGSGILLPPTVPVPRVHALVSSYRHAGGTGPVGVMRDVWVASTRQSAREDSEPWLRYSHMQYAPMEGVTGSEALAEHLDKRMQQAIVGDVDDVRGSLRPIVALGVDLVMARLRRGDQPTWLLQGAVELLVEAFDGLVKGI